MTTNLRVLIIGAGGHGKVLLDTLQTRGDCTVICLIDQEPGKKGTRTLGVEDMGDDDRVEQYKPGEVLLVNGVGSVGLPEARKRIFENWKSKGYSFHKVTHPGAIISRTARLEEDAQVLAGTVIQTDAVIGRNIIVNIRASVDHDCTIGDHCHIAPGVTLSGGIKIGPCCHIGTGATIIQGIEVGQNSVVGAPNRALKDLPSGSKFLG